VNLPDILNIYTYHKNNTLKSERGERESKLLLYPVNLPDTNKQSKENKNKNKNQLRGEPPHNNSRSPL